MIENLKIALRKQKKLIAIFFLTIFLPSVSLAIFGIRAIRNEKFRQAQQIENEHRRVADFFKTQIRSRIKAIEVLLQNLAQKPSFSEKDYTTMKDLFDNLLSDNHLVEQIFLVYRDEEPLFPLIQSVSERHIYVASSRLKESLREKIKKAEEYEFVHKDYNGAISLCRELLSLTKDRNSQAQMLSRIARNFKKLKMYQQAIKYYSRLANDYPESLTASRLPLALISRLQMFECYQKFGDFQNALKSALRLYKNILRNPWNLSEDQFKTYTSMVEEVITKVLTQNSVDFTLEEYQKEFEQLKSLHGEKFAQWQIVNDIKNEIIPELRRRFVQPESYTQFPFYLSKNINDKNFLILAVRIPEKSGKNSLGILGINIKNDYLAEDLLTKIIEEIQLSENTNITISDLSGRILYGEKNPSTEILTVTEYFEDNIPPWRIELLRSEGLGIVDIRKSFYFWTILTLILILTFGAFLIVRTVSHEMEVLKIKSDFVSSVSHELKTPLTSIKALTERLLAGKVKNPVKMKQYFSVISQDTDKLTRLVKNVLDFSKIEEGQKEYDLQETDVAHWLVQTIEDFRKDHFQPEIKIHIEIAKDIPPLPLDRDALAQAIINLLDNALKFSSEKKEVEVHVKSDEEAVIIEFKDRGIGIPQDEVGKIFDKFYQGRNAFRQSVKGTGLGLTLVKHAVEAHGGSVSVESKMGQGSMFSLNIPIKKKNE